jgi:hypothetical protein
MLTVVTKIRLMELKATGMVIMQLVDVVLSSKLSHDLLSLIFVSRIVGMIMRSNEILLRYS